MSIVLINASPSRHSRSAALLQAVECGLQQRDCTLPLVHVRILDLSAAHLLAGQRSERSIADAVDSLAKAHTLVLATPIYQAAYSGALKLFLDILPQAALRGKTVLPLATAGSPHHMLALDYALRPVLQALAAHQVLAGVYALSEHIQIQPQGAVMLAAPLAQRVQEAIDMLVIAMNNQKRCRA